MRLAQVDTYKGARSHEALEAYVQKMADEEVEEVADDERDKVPDAVEVSQCNSAVMRSISAAAH